MKIKAQSFNGSYILVVDFEFYKTNNIGTIASGLKLDLLELIVQVNQYQGMLIDQKVSFKTRYRLNKFIQEVIEPIYIMNVLKYGESFFLDNLKIMTRHIKVKLPLPIEYINLTFTISK